MGSRPAVHEITAVEILAEIDVNLRAGVPLPPGQASKEQYSGFGLHGHCARPGAADTLLFSSDGELIGGHYSGTTDPPSPPARYFPG